MTRGQQPVDPGHGGDQPGALSFVEQFEQGSGRLVAAGVEGRPLGAARVGEPDRAHTSVPGMGCHGHQTVGLQGAREPADVPGVESEALAQPPYVLALCAGLPEQPGLADGSLAAQVEVAEHTRSQRDGAVEPPYLVDLRRVHALTSVREVAVGRHRPPRPKGGLTVAKGML